MNITLKKSTLLVLLAQQNQYRCCRSSAGHAEPVQVLQVCHQVLLEREGEDEDEDDEDGVWLVMTSCQLTLCSLSLCWSTVLFIRLLRLRPCKGRVQLK